MAIILKKHVSVANEVASQLDFWPFDRFSFTGPDGTDVFKFTAGIFRPKLGLQRVDIWARLEHASALTGHLYVDGLSPVSVMQADNPPVVAFPVQMQSGSPFVYKAFVSTDTYISPVQIAPPELFTVRIEVQPAGAPLADVKLSLHVRTIR